MAEAIQMPKLGFDMAEGTLVSWKKQVGETINKGDVIADIETDKATIEIEATAGGVVLQLLAQPGDAVPVGADIAIVGAAGEKAGEVAASRPAGTATAPADVQAAEAMGATVAPRHPESTAEVQAMGQPGADTPPKTPEQISGTQVERPMELGPTPVAPAEGNGGYPGGVKASPLAKRVAAEKGIDLKQIKGSGPGGRVVREDVEKFTPGAAPQAPEGRPSAAPAPAARPAAIPAPSFGPVPQAPDAETVELSRMRARIGTRMVESKQQVPHFYVTVEIDVEAMLALRQQLNAGLDDAQKISVNDLVVKAAALTLRQFPNLNTHFYGDKLVRYHRINIGIAVPMNQGGLINVVAKDADRISLGTMAAQNKEMIARAREGKIKPDDVEGSTFTVSNLGPYDVDSFVAIINPPEAGILAVGSARKVPVVKEDGSIGVGNRMKVTISVDHRVSDGAEAARYMQAFKQLIENPMRLLI